MLSIEYDVYRLRAMRSMRSSKKPVDELITLPAELNKTRIMLVT